MTFFAGGLLARDATATLAGAFDFETARPAFAGDRAALAAALFLAASAARGADFRFGLSFVAAFAAGLGADLRDRVAALLEPRPDGEAETLVRITLENPRPTLRAGSRADAR